MEEKILDMLSELCDDDTVKTDKNVDLFETGLLDSLGFTELLVDIEDQFSIIIAPSEIDRRDMNTPQKIIDLIKARS